MKSAQKAVLVIGAGIGGIKASLELAESGVQVYLCDRRPYIGGTLSQLDEWFPDDHCGLCQVLPLSLDVDSQYCLRWGLNHPGIEQLPLTEVEKVEGEAGDFHVTLRTQPFGVESERCTGCGVCEPVCPVEVDSEFDEGLRKHKAVHPRHPLGSASNIYVIDYQSCTRCGICVEQCPTGAIELSSVPEPREIKVSAIIVATGFEEFDPRPATQYGYKRFPNVVTSIELERLLSGTGPTRGELRRLSDGQVPQSVAFLQCVGSRTRENDYCSSACCLYALKEAMVIKRKYPSTRVSFFFMELRDFGKGCHRYYEKAAALGVEFVRCRVPRVGQDFRNKNLRLTVSTDEGEIVTREFELVVLSVGQTPPPRFETLSRVLGLKLNKWGFCPTEKFAPVETGRKGIYVCGSVSEPKDIADTVTEATAAAGRALALVAPDRQPALEMKLPVPEEPRIAIYVCNCGEDIGRAVNIKEVLEFSRRLPDVVLAQEVDFPCQAEVLKKVVSQSKKAGANRIILAGFSVANLSALNGEIPIELVNLREELAWVHRDDSWQATEKAKRLIAMAGEKMRRREDWPLPTPTPVSPRALVIGGGLAGLVACLSLAERGFEVEMVEKSGTLGGHSRRLHSLLDGSDFRVWLQDLINRVEEKPSVHIWKETEVAGVTGSTGDFGVTLKQRDDEEYLIEAGAIIVAAGAGELRPVEYAYGEARKVLTQLELEEKLAAGEIKPAELKSVAMIQCVGSRDSQRPYCSRVCCSQAVKNALNLRQQNPGLRVTIFYRDMMTYGLREEYYTAAREQGIEFVRYELDQKPEVALKGGKLEIRAREPVLGGELVLQPDRLVLSPAIMPGDNVSLSRRLGVELDEDGFFREAELKFRPVDFLKEGIYVCGLAHSPRDVAETIVQAQAAAQRAAQLLWREELVPPTMISEVNERWCTGCELCVKVCPFEARYKDVGERVVQVREALCRGCGACAAACPSGAAQLRELTDRQLISMLDAAL